MREWKRNITRSVLYNDADLPIAAIEKRNEEKNEYYYQIYLGFINYIDQDTIELEELETLEDAERKVTDMIKNVCQWYINDLEKLKKFLSDNDEWFE